MPGDYRMGERTRRLPRHPPAARERGRPVLRARTSDDYGGGHMAKGKKKGGLLVGLLIGAAIGLLFAPKKGKELRDQLFGGSLGEQKSRLQDAVDAGRQSAETRSETLRQKIEETRQRLREQMGDS